MGGCLCNAGEDHFATGQNLLWGRASKGEKAKTGKGEKAEKGAEDPGVLRKNKYGVKKRDERVNMLAVSRLPVSMLVLLYPVPHQYSLSCLY